MVSIYIRMTGYSTGDGSARAGLTLRYLILKAPVSRVHAGGWVGLSGCLACRKRQQQENMIEQLNSHGHMCMSCDNTNYYFITGRVVERTQTSVVI